MYSKKVHNLPSFSTILINRFQSNNNVYNNSNIFIYIIVIVAVVVVKYATFCCQTVSVLLRYTPSLDIKICTGQALIVVVKTCKSYTSLIEVLACLEAGKKSSLSFKYLTRFYQVSQLYLDFDRFRETSKIFVQNFRKFLEVSLNISLSFVKLR